jgi:hypothetical protein
MDGDLPTHYNRFGTPLPHNAAKLLSKVYDIKGNEIPSLDTVPEEKFVYVHGKRNLSSSSTSPNIVDKKLKPFVSPNRFEVLQSDDDSSECAFLPPSDQTAVRKTQSRPDINKNTTRSQPIYIKNITNFTSFKNKLIQLTCINGFTCKATSSYLIVRPSGPDNAKLILDHLRNTDSDFHTFCPPSSRPFRIVIRNLHQSTLSSDISDAITELGYSVRHVENIKKNKISLPLFFVDLNPNINNSHIFKITRLLHTSVVVEQLYKSKFSIPQCHKCQVYGHTKTYCSHKPRCVKCGEEHLSDICSKDNSQPAKCALCAGAHTSSYKGCPVYKKQAASFRKQKEGRHSISFSRPSKPTQSGNPCSSNQTRTYADATINQPPVESPGNLIKRINDVLNLLYPLIKSLMTVLNNLNSILSTP